MKYKNYKVIKTSYDKEKIPTTYEVKKKSFLGIWYNFNNNEYYTDGFYDTEKKAWEAIDIHIASKKPKKEEIKK